MAFPRLSPRAGMLLVVLFWAGNFTAAKIAFRDQMDPLAFTAVRFALASLVLWGIARLVEGRVPLPSGSFWKLVMLGVTGNTLYQICFMEGLQRTSAIKTSLILAGMPALVTFAAGVLGVERVTSAQRVAVLLATVGVVVVILGRGGSIDSGFGPGELLLLGAVGLWAVYALLLRRWALPMSTLQLTAWSTYTGTPGLVLAAIPAMRHTPWHAISVAAWTGLFYSSLLSLVAAYIFWNRAVVMLGAARTVAYNLMVPLVAAVIAMFALHERPGLIHLFGGALIIGGVLLTGKGQVAPEG